MSNESKFAEGIMLLDFTVKNAKDHNEPSVDLRTLERILEMVNGERLDKK